MKSTTAFSLIFLVISQLTGCVFSPGQNLSGPGKKHYAGRYKLSFDKRVEIFPLTPLIEKLRPPGRNLRQILIWMSRSKTGNTVLVQATS
jgi:hypothetical protein